MTPDPCRAAFEKKYGVLNLKRNRFDSYNYIDPITCHSWDVWQTAWNARSEVSIEAGAKALRLVATHDMLVAGARSIGRTMREDNHSARAKDCWDSMIRAKDTGELGCIPSADYRKAKEK